jgi:hypothetical protein
MYSPQPPLHLQVLHQKSIIEIVHCLVILEYDKRKKVSTHLVYQSGPEQKKIRSKGITAKRTTRQDNQLHNNNKVEKRKRNLHWISAFALYATSAVAGAGAGRPE